MKISKAIHYEFNSVSILDGKVSPVMCADDWVAPYLAYRTTDNEVMKTQTKFEKLNMVQFELDFYHNSYSQLMTLKGLVIDKAKSMLLSTIGEESLFCQDIDIDDEYEDYDYDTNLFHGQITINISYNKI